MIKKLMAVSLCFIMLLGGCGSKSNNETNLSGPTGRPWLPGMVTVYPTVLVNGIYYKWDSTDESDFTGLDYYGKLNHIYADCPIEDCDLASVFEIDGDIYTIPNDDRCVCLNISTEWFTDTKVYFKKAEDQKTLKNTKKHSFGFEEIYPAIMLNGEIYEWHRGVGIVGYGEDKVNSLKLKENIVDYGKINHTTDKKPKNELDFSSVFDVDGEIYIIPGNDEYIYVYMSSYWIEDAVIRFDSVSDSSRE
jgi:hypothetical protein